MRWFISLSIALTGLVSSSSVRAGGYDTPMLYTARHMGMGGAAIGYVNDPSALFHNPAGLSHTDFISVTANFSPLLGAMTSSPATDDQNADSEITFAPFFLAGAGFRVTDFMTLGIGLYPVASAGGEYIYINQVGKEMEDRTKLFFFEIAPGISFDLPFDIRIGATYRITMVNLVRYQGPTNGGQATFDMDLTGWSFLGFKVGVQWQPFEFLQVGVVYRHQTSTEILADDSVILVPAGETSMEFVLPSKLGFGVRGDYFGFGLAVDFEYNFNGQNDMAWIQVEGEDVLANHYHWSDSFTLRAGLEYNLLQLLKIRAGYAFDSRTSNKQYPTAFGTPPAPTHIITTGVGMTFANLVEVNLAYAYRFGGTSVTREDLDGAEEMCLPCSKAGDYDLYLHGFYIDVSVYF